MILCAHRRNPRRRQAGFSFVEVLFAVFLTACCATIVAAAMPVATLSRTKADSANTAAAIAQKEMEAVRGLGYANLTGTQLYANGLTDSSTPIATNTWSFSKVDSDIDDSSETALAGGTGRILVEQVDAELRRITVTVAWKERGAARSFVLGTLVANL